MVKVVTYVPQSLLSIVIVAVSVTGGMVVPLGRKPELHETIVILLLTWAATWLAAIIIVWLGRRPTDIGT